MIAAFAKTARAFGNEEFLQAAITANAFVEAEMKQEDNGLSLPQLCLRAAADQLVGNVEEKIEIAWLPGFFLLS